MNNPPITLTPEEEEYLQGKYKHLVMLLNNSVLPDQVKSAWAEVVPELTMDQLNTLIKILEQEIPVAISALQNNPADQRVIDKIKEATDFHNEELDNIEHRTIKALQELEEELPSV